MWEGFQFFPRCIFIPLYFLLLCLFKYCSYSLSFVFNGTFPQQHFQSCPPENNPYNANIWPCRGELQTLWIHTQMHTHTYIHCLFSGMMVIRASGWRFDLLFSSFSRPPLDHELCVCACVCVSERARDTHTHGDSEAFPSCSVSFMCCFVSVFWWYSWKDWSKPGGSNPTEGDTRVFPHVCASTIVKTVTDAHKTQWWLLIILF